MTLLAAVVVLAAIGLRLALLVHQAAASRSPQPARPAAGFDPCLGPFVVRRPPPATAEGQLVSALVAGAIDRKRYRREMAALAEDDQAGA